MGRVSPFRASCQALAETFVWRLEDHGLPKQADHFKKHGQIFIGCFLNFLFDFFSIKGLVNSPLTPVWDTVVDLKSIACFQVRWTEARWKSQSIGKTSIGKTSIGKTSIGKTSIGNTSAVYRQCPRKGKV
jgi:hypothetical protein